MRPAKKSPQELRLESRDYGGLVFAVIFISVGLFPWLYPSLEICSQAPDACSYGTSSFVAVGLLFGLLGTRRYTTVLDREQNHYHTTYWRPYRTSRNEGAVSDITGTLEMLAGGSQTRKTQLSVLDVNAGCHPVALPGTPGSRRTRKAASSIRSLLGLEESRSLQSWDLKPSLSELGSSLRGVAVQAEEAEALGATLENSPTDISGFRQLALRLMRLDRRDEAGVILRNAHRHFLDQGAGDDANHIAGIISTFRL